MHNIVKSVAIGLLSGTFLPSCTNVQNQPVNFTAAALAEFQRTESCVYGGLPMDVQFNVADVPPRISGLSSFGDAEAAELQRALDIKLLDLLKVSMAEALAKQPTSNALDYNSLSLDFETAMVTHAGDSLHLTFCGNIQKVGSTVMAAVAGWFSRAVDHVQEGAPLTRWFAQLGPNGTAHEVEFIMLATALHAERPDIGTDRLLDAFRVYVASQRTHQQR